MTRGRTAASRAVAVVAVYASAAVAAFFPILRTGFVADDWIFLSYAVPAHSIAVCFAPLVGHFVRPMVMLTYYVNYRLFGLRPLPFHLTVLAVHVASAYLVYRLAQRATGSWRVAFWAGLIFATFAGHSEAVGWVAGAADPWLTVFLLSGLLLFARGLEQERAWPALAAATVILAAGYLAKESAAIAAGLVAAWGVSAASFGDRARAPRTILRTVAVAGALACVTAAYLFMRSRVFGSPFGSYNDLNADRSILAQEAVAFVLRSFYPATGAFALSMYRRLGLAVIAAALIGLAVHAWREPGRRAGLLFLSAAFAVALAPVLPLTISLAGTTSERFVYVPTAFSCIVIAWAIDSVTGAARIATAVLSLAVVAVQYPAFARSHAERVAAARLFQTFMADTVALLRAQAPAGSQTRVFFLTLPDSLGGAVVARSAFHPALSVLAPEFTDREWRAVFVATHDLRTPQDVTTMTREGPGRFRIALSAGRFLEGRPAANPDFTVEEWGPTGYAISFLPSRWRRIVAYESQGRLHTAGGLEGAVLDGIPFGSVDIPADGATCEGSSLRFSGWALDDREGLEVVVRRETAPGVWSDVARAEWRSGTRPDVAKLFAGYPQAERGEWDYWLPCAPSDSAPARLRIVARDSAGHEVALGERTVSFPRRGR